MATRIYVCPIIGDGTSDNSFRPLIADLLTEGGFSDAVIGSNLEPSPDRGKPRLTWTMLHVHTNNWTPIEADANCVPVDITNVDRDLTTQERNAIRQRTLLSTAEANALITIRDAIRYLFKMHYGYNLTDDEVNARADQYIIRAQAAV